MDNLNSIEGKTLDGDPPVSANAVPNLINLYREYRCIYDGIKDKDGVLCMETLEVVLRDLRSVINE